MRKLALLLCLLLIFPQVVFARSAVIDITEMNINEIQDAVDKGLINYELLTELYLERIEEYDDDYNAVSFINEDALEEARKLDIEYDKSGRRSPLHGIPVIVKDNIDVVGFPTTASSKILLNNFPKENALLIQKLLDAGAIIIAKGRMSEFAFSASESHNSYGHVYNAYDNAYTPYGSSGGVAVSVALSFAQVGIGTDTNSSIRTPASAANLIGLRPTYGLISDMGIIPYDKERDTAGSLTKNALDAALVMTVINSEDKAYNIKFTEDLEQYKFGFLEELYDTNSIRTDKFASATNSSIAKLMDELYVKLESYSADVKKINTFYNSSKFALSTSTYTGILFCYDFNQYIKGTDGPIKSYNDMLLGTGYTKDLEYYNEYCNTDYRNTSLYKTKVEDKKEFEEYVLKIMDENGVDFLVYPTTKNIIPTISSGSVVSSLSPLIAPPTGMPSINIQLGFIDSLPYGFEIVGRKGSEQSLLEIAAYYDSISQSFKGVEEAPSIYEINDNLVELLDFHNKYYGNGLYEHLIKKSKAIFLNIDDATEAEIGDLLNEYKTYSPPTVDVIIEKFKTDRFLLGSFVVIVALILLILYNYLKLAKAQKKIISKKR